jgi:hypothetical protein
LGRDFDQVEPGFAREFERLAGGQNSQHGPVMVDHADRRDSNLLVDSLAALRVSFIPIERSDGYLPN